MGMAATLSCDMDHLNIRSLVPKRLHMKFGFNPPVVSEEKMFENVDNTHIHVHTYDRGLPIL